MRDFQDYLNKKRQEFGEKFDPSELAKQFIPYFQSGQRIEVKFKFGEVKRGTIGVTAGWKPAFLLMLRRDSIGSPFTLSDSDKIIKIIN